MQILVLQENADLGSIWSAFLERRGLTPRLATNAEKAMGFLSRRPYDVLVFDPAVQTGALALADFATFRNPDVKILAVTASSFFSDGTLFDLIPNARGVLRQPVRPEDLAAYLEHFKERKSETDEPQACTA